MAISKALRDQANELSRAAERLILPSQLKPLLALARAYARIQERWCSEDMSGTPGLQASLEKKEKTLEEHIRKIAHELPGVQGVKFTGDPRGFCVRLLLTNGKYNTWGGVEDGWGIA